MMKSFRDPVTNVLKAYGSTLSNAPGDLVRDEPDTFNLEPGKWLLVTGAWVTNLPTFAQKQSSLVARIRQEASDIIRDTILSLGTEYQQARKDADEFFARAPAYSGTAPRSVLDWANAKIPAATTQWACDDIRATALNWETKELDIRQNRLKYAEQAKAATAASVAPNDLDSILANWTAFKNPTRTALGI